VPGWGAGSGSTNRLTSHRAWNWQIGINSESEQVHGTFHPWQSGDGDKKAHATNEAQLIPPHAGMKSVCFGNDDDYFLCGISKNNLREVAKKFKRDSSTFYIIPG